MKIKLNLAQAHFIKLIMETFEEAENEPKENKLMAKDIISKLNK